ncbi:MAG: hypothetical protein M1830_006310 [Pleopsidium flavum]|nr:MAG: hypothetical protein M1830_006310 [Pleopsidium flavum]
MRFSITLVASALVALATAQYPQNPFNIPAGGLYFAVGTPTTLSWAPTTPGTVSLYLRDGVTTNLNPGILLAYSHLPIERIALTQRVFLAGIINSGTFTYTPAAANSIAGTLYTVEIVSDADPSLFNFTPQFVINGAGGAVAGPPAAVPTVTGPERKYALLLLLLLLLLLFLFFFFVFSFFFDFWELYWHEPNVDCSLKKDKRFALNHVDRERPCDLTLSRNFNGEFIEFEGGELGGV